MDILLILIILGLFTYFTIKRSIGNFTRTPVWLCWLVVMTPAFIWSAWVIYFGEDEPPPIALIFGSFIACLFLYGWLIQQGKIKAENTEETPQDEPDTSPNSHRNNNLAATKPITAEEEAALRNCFPWGVYYLDRIIYRPQAIICLGKLRTVPENAYETIKTNIENLFGDRFFLIFQESFQGQPFFALVPNPQATANNAQAKVKNKLIRPGLALSLLLLTFLSTTLVGAEISGVTAEELTNNPQLFWQGLPYSLGLIAILAAHEFAHFFFIRKYKIDSTLPYFIPFPFFLGTFGAFIQKRSPVPHRQALFDIAIAGPIAGLLVTLPLLIAGLSLSDTVAITTENGNNILNFQALDPRFSFFLALISKLSLGQALEPNMAINLHPLAVAGYLGVIITALNLMPVGQLDGGHIAHAMFGQGKAVIIGQVTRFLAIALALVQPYLWVWVIFLWLIPLVDQPTLNDVTDLSDWRDFCGLLCFALLIIILLPLPHTVAQWLNI